MAPLPVAATDESPALERLPALEELVAQVPIEVRDALDDLFRAKFAAVRRISPGNMKNRTKS
jgi:hypothetical protein